jgi:hypothetical protein
MFISAFCAVSTVFASACQDPYTFQLREGSCTLNIGCIAPVGFYVVEGSYTDGGCLAPGNSAKKCVVDSVIANWTHKVGQGGPATDSCGKKAFASCTTVTTSLWGLKKGRATNEPGDYGDPCNGVFE